MGAEGHEGHKVVFYVERPGGYMTAEAADVLSFPTLNALKPLRDKTGAVVPFQRELPVQWLRFSARP